jgi:hypothetical protein
MAEVYTVHVHLKSGTVATFEGTNVDIQQDEGSDALRRLAATHTEGPRLAFIDPSAVAAIVVEVKAAAPAERPLTPAAG